MSEYQALLVVSFGGPDGPEDVLPFLENVTRGRGISRQRLEEVAEHYHHFGGKSPINEQNRALITALEGELARKQLDLPVFFGNRNWHPLLGDTLAQMRSQGIQRALAFFTSAFSCYSGCRQYRENLAEARGQLGPGAPEVDKLRMFYNHPGFLLPLAEQMANCLRPLESKKVEVLFTAHSIPESMAANCRYQQQLEEACRIVADQAGLSSYQLVYQSRSGPPQQPWLGPDICERIRELAQQGVAEVVVSPLGFISDHMEVLYDLDTEAADLCRELGLGFHRLPTIGTHPDFVSMIVELVEERLGRVSQRRSLGQHGPSHDVCPAHCCLR